MASKNKTAKQRRRAKEQRQRKKARMRLLSQYAHKMKKERVAMIYITIFYSAVFIGFIYIVYQLIKELINHF